MNAVPEHRPVAAVEVHSERQGQGQSYRVIGAFFGFTNNISILEGRAGWADRWNV